MDEIEREVRDVVLNAKKRAKKAGYIIEVNYEYIMDQIIDQDHCCVLTGLPFNYSKSSPYFRRPFAPSLDRIDSVKGYEKDNVRVVCYAANAAMNEWGEDVLRVVATSYVKNNKDGGEKGVLKKSQLAFLTDIQKVKDYTETMRRVNDHSRRAKKHLDNIEPLIKQILRGKARLVLDIPQALEGTAGNLKSILKLTRGFTV